jgi:hypothetical protein
MDQEVEVVAWKILQALHEDVPEQSRPKSWSDLKGDQGQRIRAAAVAAIAAIECIRGRNVRPKPRPTLSELEELLKERPDDPPINIKSDGSIEVRKPLTMGLKLGDEYGVGGINLQLNEA